MTDNIITLRSGVLVSDIPGQLRLLADKIDAGKVTAESLVVIIPNDGYYPVIYGWGEAMGMHERLGVLDAAHAWIVANQINEPPEDDE